ncbi:uncharacterized protein PAC_10550 [Phialocephala subalpina]|uniref:Uncharacterized protein n=1 Tax=Phialocephala subalpina TaxID=576137 RepID=A0A1L7X6L9_9HELO|nr:uncharacterized protein PAC_10550 [Phialocephala subalpina]
MLHQQMPELLQWHCEEANNASFIRDTDIGFSLSSMALQPIPTGLQRQIFIRGPAALQTEPCKTAPAREISGGEAVELSLRRSRSRSLQSSFANDAQAGQPVLESYGQASFDRLKAINALKFSLHLFDQTSPSPSPTKRQAMKRASVPLAQPSLWPMSRGSCAIARKSVSNPMQMLENEFLSTSDNDADNGRATRFVKAAVASSRSGKSSNGLNCD